MAPTSIFPFAVAEPVSASIRSKDDDGSGGNSISEQVIVEAWAQGFSVGSLILLVLLILCNYRRHVLLHKLILLELILAMGHGLFIFFQAPVYGWFLSSTAVPLYVSYTIHNLVAWLKIKPFLPQWGARTFLVAIILVQPYWVLETWANFEYFNNLGSKVFETSRCLEPLMRDPWWVFTTIKLVQVINKNYDISFINLVRVSPRFGVMLFCLFLSIVFLISDVVFTARVSKQSGINPFWRLSLVFKCASDVIFLDDFKIVLDRISASFLKRIGHIPCMSQEGHTTSGRYGGSASQRGSEARHFSTASATNTAGREDQKKYSGYSKWPKSHLTSQRRGGKVDRHLPTNDGAIMVKTTIDVSEQENTTRESSASSMKRYGSQDNILPLEDVNSTAPRRTWDPLMSQSEQRQAQDSTGNIPMIPLRAITKDENFNSTGSSY